MSGEITAEMVQRARAQGRGPNRPKVLQEASGLEGTDFLRALGEAFAYPVMDMAALRDLTPAFGQLPFAQALARECAAGRDASGRLWLVHADPLDAGLIDWAERVIGEPFTPALALRDDLLAWLHRQEADLKAMDGVIAVAGESR
ncbi:MAG: type II/IV secretion system protein, partial [Thiobacillaceae bacterium]